MNYKLLCILLAAGTLLFTACNDEESWNPSNRDNLISLNYPENFYAAFKNVYHYANSMDGKLLASKELSVSGNDFFEVSRAENGAYNRFDLTRAYIQESGNKKYISLSTYIGILPFSKDYDLTYQPSIPIGPAIVKFTNVPPYTSFIISSAKSTTNYGDLNTRTYYFNLYDNLPRCIFITLNTPSGSLYKFVDNLVPDQTTTISLADMNNIYTSGTVNFDKKSFNSFHIEFGRYYTNDFTSPHFYLFDTEFAAPPASLSIPSLFLANKYSRTELTGFHNEPGYPADKESICLVYSSTPPVHASLMDGELYLPDKYFYNNFKYDFSSDQIVHLVSFSWSHSSDFLNANGFRVSWTVYVSPSIREFYIPAIPESILKSIEDHHGISDLYIEGMRMGNSVLSWSSRTDDFDDYMERYFLGSGGTAPNDEFRHLVFYNTDTKNNSSVSSPGTGYDPHEKIRW